MITEDYVSFDTAKLLKEKGFDGDADKSYSSIGAVLPTSLLKIASSVNEEETYILCPTLQIVMKWLRENKGLFIHIHIIREVSCWLSEVFDIFGCNKMWVVQKESDSYEEAAESAILFCLENLI